MIRISKLADYGTVVLSHLADDPRQRLSAAQVAEVTEIPIPTVSKLLKQLNEAELVSSTRGANGGYQLARAPQEITVAEIISAIDGQLAMTDCSKSIENCVHLDKCGLRHNWQHINNMIVMLLEQLSLADMNRPLNKIIKIETLEEPHER